MPIFSDLSLYYCGSSTPLPPSFYSNHVSSFTSPSTSYTPRGGVYSGYSSGFSLLNLSPRLLPMPPRVNKYSPLLPTISETSSLPAFPLRPLPRISSPRVVPAYRAPRPINIDTADIDVSTPRKRTDRISRDRDDSQQGTIKRGRTVVRLHTKRLKENPGLVQNRRMTPGEKLVEKFLIKDKQTEQAKRKEGETEASSPKHVRRSCDVQEGEDERSNTSRRKSVKDLERLIDCGEPERISSKKELVGGGEVQDVITVTQSEALDLLLSETDNETEIISTKPGLSPEPPPGEKYVSVKDKQKSQTVKKRPRKRDKGSTIKRFDHNEAPVSQAPAEKSLLQRRNTVKKLRRNSRDIESLILAIDERESSKLSTPAGLLPMPASTITSTPTTSTTSTPINSTPSTPVTPVVETLPLDVRRPVVFESQCSNRDMYPFKTKVSDRKSEPNVSKIVSAEISVENAGDLIKKMPLKFVVDEIKVEETQKSPKLLRYEVTVEEVGNSEMPFQKDERAERSELLDESTCDSTIKHGLKPAESDVTYNSASVPNRKEESEFTFNRTHESQKAEIIPETVPEVEVSLSNIAESNSKQVDSLSFSPDIRYNEKGRNQQALTAGSEMTDFPSLVHMYSKQDADGDSGSGKDGFENEEIKYTASECDTKASPTEKEFNQVEILKNTTPVNKFTVHKDVTGTPKAQHRDKIEKDTSNKKLMEYLKITERNSSSQRPEIPLTSGQKNEQCSIPAWKKALIARTQASNASKAQSQIGMQQNCQLSPVSQVSNKDNTTTSNEKTLKAIVESRNENCESLLQDTKPPAILSTESCSNISEPETTEEDQIENTKSADADSLCGNSSPEKAALQSAKSDPAEKLEIQVTEGKKSAEALSADQNVKHFGKAEAENLNNAAVGLYSSKEKKNADERQILENKLKPIQPLSAGNDKSAETKLESVQLKHAERTHVGTAKATEATPKENKAKQPHATVANGTKAGELEMTKGKLKPPQRLPEQKSPPNMNLSKCETISETVGIETLAAKLKHVEKKDVNEPKTTIEPPVGKKVTTEIKPGGEKTIPAGESPVEELMSTETEMPANSPASVRDEERGEEPRNPELKTSAVEEELVGRSAASVGTKLKDSKPVPAGNEPKQTKTNPPEKKLMPVNAEVSSHLKSTGTLAAETGKPCVTSVVEEPDSASCAATAEPESKDTAEEISSEDEADSEEETDTETDDDGDDDGEEVRRLSQRASTSSSEDSGFDSLPTSVPGSPAYYKKDPNIKAASCSSGSSTDSAISSATLSSSSTLGLDPYDDHSPTSTLARSGRVTPPATTIPRFRKYTVEDFHFLKVLGKGSFGKVLLAELKGTECYYAVKCLKKDVVLEDDDVECTLIERKVLALGTKHPYLCHLFCTFQTESHLFFVMEYLNGGDLMFHIQQTGRFPEQRARFYAAEIVSGLKFLHKKGVVYRDLKLDNILLDFDGHVRIADFGMCKLQIYLDRTADTFCGTPDYMAPEIIKGLKYNQCVDWWSFGVLLYEMLIGQSPFSGCDEDDLFWSICNEQPQYPRFLSREANSILHLFLEKDSSKRLGTNGSMAGDVVDQPFFRNIDWNALERRELEPPFKPRVQHPLDVQYFDKAFTAERAKLTPVQKEILQSMDQTQFQGFSYTNPNATD
ncbi:serine/threonine-protein kinase pakA isoform X2 [Cryptotermes secundus]|uniref:serine/threonine-protein kinase pakA isoform X2 n=1 Tax=Cryptotermes secundus TaxID=105785 RepID=UPI000CD7B51E|nr:serine/threonine-protein kinase pakA isoform X2 [Cryptotermes secundus]